MEKKTKNRIWLSVAGVLLLLTAVLCIHIYVVTRPGPPTDRMVMARIDFRQDIDANDALKIVKWLYAQPGVNQVLCNDKSDIAVFTFSTAKNDANSIVAAFKDQTGYKADRYLPSEKEMRSGCPMNYGSTMSKITSLFKG
ncbi:MAG: hypothetical protein KF744_06030 [Taibaiella sp.]|nr:hypothetical protein [Taibaiella sp.]